MVGYLQTVTSLVYRRFPRLFTDGFLGYLQPRKAHQVGTQTEARALARRQANARGHEVQERERHRRDNRHRQDLLHLQLLLGDDEGRQRHREALQEILDRTGNELSNCETVHTYNLGGENLLMEG